MTPGFNRVWAAAGVSNLGDGIFGAALPLLVASITRDPLLVSGVTLAGRIPWLLFGLVSGALVDRMDRKKVMVVTDLLRAAGITLLALAVATDTAGLSLLYVLAFGFGLAETFFDTSSEAIMPSLVGPDQLPSANARLQGVEFVGNAFIGPPVGAFLFTVAAAAPFFVNGGLVLAAALFVLAVPGTFRTADAEVGPMLKNVASGMRWLWAQKVVRTLAFLAGSTNMLTFAIIAIFVLFAQERLGVSDVGYGVLLSLLGVGGLTGAVIAPRVVRMLGPGNAIRTTLWIQGIAFIVMSQLTAPAPAGVVLFLFSACTAVWNVVAVSLRQSLTPDALRGRVAGATRTLAWGFQPLGALMGGLIASALGLQAPFYLAAAGTLLSMLLTWRIISNRTIEAARSAAPA
ncbi:MAG TPA: MFS transporter [Acidimicrobiia bacterium]